MKLYDINHFEYQYSSGDHDKTCWFFGDSFTKGSGCLDTKYNIPHENEYFDKIDKPGKIWVDLLCDDLQMNKMNLGIAGTSLDILINVLFDYAKQIKKDDYIFFGIPSLSRKLLFTDDGKPFNLNSVDDESAPYLESYVNYFYEHVELKRYHWYNYYFHLVDKMLKYFTPNYFIWFVDFTDFLKFEKINQVSDVKDTHWSFKGHEQFYEYVKNNLTSWYSKENIISTSHQSMGMEYLPPIHKLKII